MFYIGIDIGTTTIKCGLFSKEMRCVASASKEYPVHIRQGIWVHQRANDWWYGTVQTIRETLDKSGVSPKEIGGIGVSCQTPTMLPLDKDGEALFDALIWMDRRADAECEHIVRRLGKERIFQITGNQMDSFNLAPKLLWFRKNHPELMGRTHQFLQANGYVNYMLTGKFSVDRSNASVTLLYDIHKADWSGELLDAVGVSREHLPPIYEGQEIIGGVSDHAASQTGLMAGTPVIAGTIDALAGGIDAGVLSGGMAFEATGTSSVFLIPFESIRTTPYLPTAVGLRARQGILYGAMNTSGAAYKWFRDELMGGENKENTMYAQMDAITARTAPDPTGLLFLPYMTGERSPIWDSDARGVFFGLELSTSRGQMMRAIMEGTSFALRSNMEAAEKAGVNISRLRSVGGCCKSELWLKIKASVIGMPIEIPKRTSGSPGGLALMLAAATGRYATIDDAAHSCIEIERVVNPVPEWTGYYDEMYRHFMQLYEHTKQDFAALGRLKAD